MALRRGLAAVESLKSTPFEAGLLPDQEKERLCRDLLAEFGVTQISLRGEGEMVHSCCLPYGGHKNGDASASASLNYLKLTYNCLGCGSSGGFLWFIATCRGEDSDAARRWLEDQTGSGPDEQSLASLLQFFDAVYGQKDAQAANPIPKMSISVLAPWRRIHPYMTEDRRIPEKTLMRFSVGYAENYRVKVGEDDNLKPVFVESPRIILPHFWKGDLVGWQSRRLINDGTPKYVNTPDFPKDTTIYNYDEHARSVVTVESPLSVLAGADDEGYHYEGTFGAKVTDRQIRLMSMHSRNVLWMDNDDAGWKATARLAEGLESYSDVWVVDSPWNADRADLSHEEALRLLADPVPYALWRPPAVLYCWKCKEVAHDGECARQLASA